MLTTKIPRNQQPTYPSTSFTFKNLEELNPGFPVPTLRLRLKQAINEGRVKKSEDKIKGAGPGRAEFVYYSV